MEAYLAHDSGSWEVQDQGTVSGEHLLAAGIDSKACSCAQTAGQIRAEFTNLLVSPTHPLANNISMVIRTEPL